MDKHKLGMRMFELLGSLENEECLDFGEFMKAVGTFCMLGQVILGCFFESDPVLLTSAVVYGARQEGGAT
jgi:hypothetical protein